MQSSLLSEFTTLGVGGPADTMAFPRNADEVAALVRDCADAEKPWRVLGKGSNLLVDDAGVRGVVINTSHLRGLVIRHDGRVVAGAGLSTATLRSEAMHAGFGGLECTVGYPATAGGAARMNAGGRWGETGSRIESVVVVDEAGEIRELSHDECQFGYRTSALGRSVVAEIVFRLPEVDVEAYRVAIEDIRRDKTAAQPLADRSAGCMFRNPEGGSAGRLIDGCGLKGRALGGAMVSTIHGNFIVNRGGATCDDVLRLADIVRDEVALRFGVELHREVEIWRA